MHIKRFKVLTWKGRIKIKGRTYIHMCVRSKIAERKIKIQIQFCIDSYFVDCSRSHMSIFHFWHEKLLCRSEILIRHTSKWMNERMNEREKPIDSYETRYKNVILLFCPSHDRNMCANAIANILYRQKNFFSKWRMYGSSHC